MTQTRLVLVSHALCPYVQRAAIALAEKGVPFERRTIDLADKPDWFRAISPLGKVPLLIVRGDDGSETVLFESAVICEYLEETVPGVKLHPADPLERARHRGWIEFGSAILADLWGFETAKDAETFEAKRQALTTRFAAVERELGVGPWFAGEGFSLVDAVFGPIFRYFDVFEAIADIGVFAATPKVRAWRQALAFRPSVRDAVGQDYPTGSAPFSRSTTPICSACRRTPPDLRVALFAAAPAADRQAHAAATERNRCRYWSGEIPVARLKCAERRRLWCSRRLRRSLRSTPRSSQASAWLPRSGATGVVERRIARSG